MHIWTLDLGNEHDIDPDLIQHAMGQLSDEECSRANRFLRHNDKNRFVLAHLLCRSMLSRFGDWNSAAWVFDKEERGRPFIEPDMNRKKIDFNISHTENMIGCAVALGRRVGLDLESKTRRANYKELALHQFSSREQEEVLNQTGAALAKRFFQFWTLKEAYIKVTGMGLSESLSSFGFDLGQPQPQCYLGETLLTSYRFGLFDCGQAHQGAWAVQLLPSDCNSVDASEGASAVIEPQFTSLTMQDAETLFEC